MKHSHIPRRWRWIRGAGTVACVAIVALYPVSINASAAYWSHGLRKTISLRNGQFGVLLWNGPEIFTYGDRIPSVFWCLYEPRHAVLWGFDSVVDQAGTLVILPLWAPLVAFALPTAYAWWRCARPPPGHCKKCGYDLAGNGSGVCPECGKACEPKGAVP